jgi:hypothetical protein
MSEINIPDPMPDSVDVQDHFMDIVTTQLECHEYVSKQLRLYQEKMKQRYDQHTSVDPLRVGDIVYVYQPRLNVPNTKKKLQKSFHGPYMIVKFNTPKAVVLKRLVDNKYLNKSISIKRLKRGYVRQDTNEWDAIIDLDNVGDLLDEHDLPRDSYVQTDNAQPNVIVPPAPVDQPQLPINDMSIPSQDSGIRRSTRTNKGQIVKDPNFVYSSP